MCVISKKCRTLKLQKAKVHYFPYKTSKLKVFFDGDLKLDSIAKLLLEVYAWPELKKLLPAASYTHLLMLEFFCLQHTSHNCFSCAQ